MRFFDLLAIVAALLRQRQRISYRALKREFDLDDACLADLRFELVQVAQIALDQDGEILVWAGAGPAPVERAPPPARLVALPPIGGTSDPLRSAPCPPAGSAPREVPAVLEPAVSDAERRPLTVMFCDLADSTALSTRLDPEDLQDVIRAYQACCTAIVLAYEGFVAKYMGDGILVYCGYPKSLERNAEPLAETVPLLASPLSLPVSAERCPPPTLTPQQQKQQTQDAIIAITLEAAEREPPLELCEDLHWADPSTLELLGLLIEQAPTAALLMVLTFRPEFVPPWPSRSHMTPITLNRLERQHSEALVTRLAGDKPLPADVVEHIVAKTDGVPLYVEELTKTILAAAILRATEERYELTGPLSSLAIPATLQESLMARLDRLPQVREIAQLGSVLGREFAHEMISGLSAVGETMLQEGLGQLVEAELLYQRGRAPRARYTFKHALVQDAAYQSLLRRNRQQYHQQVAELLEAKFPDVVEAQPELVAHHYSEAHVVDRAASYFQKAGQRAARQSAHPEAIAHLTKGLLGAMPNGAERARRELDLLTTLGPALIATKGYAAPKWSPPIAARWRCARSWATRRSSSLRCTVYGSFSITEVTSTPRAASPSSWSRWPRVGRTRGSISPPTGCSATP